MDEGGVVERVELWMRVELELWMRVELELWMRVELELWMRVELELWMRVELELWMRVELELWMRVELELWMRVELELWMRVELLELWMRVELVVDEAGATGAEFDVKTSRNERVIEVASINSVRASRLEIGTLIKRAFECGFEGLDDNGVERSWEDEKWVEMVESDCRKINGRYEIPLPLREGTERIPYSRGAALSRAVGLRKKLMKDERLMGYYEVCMNEMIELGYAEKIDVGEGKWYLPHFEVVHPSKPGKVRVVFDCAAKVKGVALNDMLMPGPDLASQLINVLLKFRDSEHAFTADVSAMFHQVKVPIEQRDYLRFLWWDGGVMSGTLCEYRMTVHLFGAASSPSVANYALRRIADDASCEYSERVRKILHENFYVDDCLVTSESGKILYETARDLKKLCLQGGFVLAKFGSNLPRIEQNFGEGVESCQFKKVLGVQWDKSADKLGVTPVGQFKISTKRELLSAVARVYDPLGIVAPLVLEGRLIFQSVIQRSGRDNWDEELKSGELNRIEEWMSNLSDIKDIWIPRNVVTDPRQERVQLHVFGDASESGHSAVAYARIENSLKGTRCVFLMGKAKVNPSRYVSVPRLELVAATLVARLSKKLREEMTVRFERVYLWSDSMTVLRYIRNDRVRFQSFVANRIAEIRRSTNVCEWRYVDTRSNPSDDGSRGIFSDRWKEGPGFLKKSRSEWPEEKVETRQVELNEDPEVKVCCITKLGRIESFVEKVAGRYSEWMRLIRAIAWLNRFKRWVFTNGSDCLKGVLTVNERRLAETILIRAIQRACFREEYERLEKGQEVARESTVRKLGVFMHDGLIRVGGRLRNAELDYDEKHPILIPSKHHVTELLVRYWHERAGHLGVATVLGWSRSMYWIVRGYSTVKRVVSRCVKCRKSQGRVMDQKMAELPLARVKEGEPAFTYTGTDCFGPFYVTSGRGKSQAKRYGVVFTCMTVRAVHLEVATDLSSGAVLCALRRFMARRGMVKYIRSDNGTNYVGARRVLLNSLGADRVRDGAGDLGVSWELNPPRASHFGGIWERVIRMVRRGLETVMMRKTFTDESLATTFCEVEAAINNRPLTLVGEGTYEDVLTPQKLLNLGTGIEYHGDIPEQRPDNVKRWVHIQAVAQQFWHHWCRDYRSSLQGRAKWTRDRRNAAVGDLVLLIDESLPRGTWPLGRVTEVKHSKDGLVRSVKVTSGGRTYERPIAKLIMVIEGEELA